MGLYVRKRVPIHKDSEWLNLSTSGASVSKRIGKRVTVNSRGRVFVRLAKGLYFRSR